MKNDHGMTLAELLIALVIIGMVIGLGMTFFDYLQSTYNRGEQRWIAQNNGRIASQVLVKQLEGAYYYELLAASPTSQPDEGESYLYVKNGNLMRWDHDKSAIVIASGNFTVTFNRTYDSTSTQIKNVVSVTLRSSSPSGGSNVNITSAAKCNNMIPDRGTTGTRDSGPAIRLATTSEAAPVPTASSSRCFIATAAYGSSSQVPVLILRQFRDQCLLTSSAGRSFVDFYYRNSPPIAKLISTSSTLKFMTRTLLAPVVGMAWASLNYGFTSVLAFILLVVGIALVFHRFRRISEIT